MAFSEKPLVKKHGLSELVFILHVPDEVRHSGVIIVVGGPQYRVGSHRQFVYLARFLAANGVPVLRFDYTGMGDSTGEGKNFESINEDIAIAVDAFFEQVPTMDNVILWGLCDAASASGFYAASDERIKGLVLLNPWVRTEQGESKVFLKSYYLQRFCSRDFWEKVISGDVKVTASIKSLSQKISGMYQKEPTPEEGLLPLPTRVINNLSKVTSPILFIFSGKDLTAKEFIQLVNTDKDGQALIKRNNVSRVELPDSDHTFSREEWKNQVNTVTLSWLKAL